MGGSLRGEAGLLKFSKNKNRQHRIGSGGGKSLNAG